MVKLWQLQRDRSIEFEVPISVDDLDSIHMVFKFSQQQDGIFTVPAKPNPYLQRILKGFQSLSALLAANT